MTKMTTEEAFVKVLQMHGIEHAFGIIGSAFMPISDKFPETNDYANEAFWSKMRWFKDQDWFDNTLAQTLMDAFVKLAKNSNAGATNYEINRIYVVASWWKESNVVVKNLHYIDAACDKDQLSKDDIEWTKDKNIKHLVEVIEEGKDK